MKIEFKNGSSIESIDITRFQGNIRGKRSRNVYFARPSIKTRFIEFIKNSLANLVGFRR